MKGKIELSIYGTRGSCATGSKEYSEFGGDTSAYTLKHGDTLHFLDGGTGIRRAMAKELTPEVQSAYLHITHGHADHIDMGCAGGIYFNKVPGGIKVIGYQEVESALKNFFDGKTIWPVPYAGLNGLNKEIIALDGGEKLKYSGFEIDTLRNYHPPKGDGGSIGFRFNIKRGNGLVKIAYVTDMEFDYIPGGKPQPRTNELKADFVNFVEGVDVLLADTHFTNKEYNETMQFVRGWGHSTLEQVIDLANEAKVKLLLGTHHAPQHTDEILSGLEKHARDYARTNGFQGDFAFAKDGDRLIF